MEELVLIDILQTLCIGVFSLTLIIYFYFFINKFFVKDKFNQDGFFDWLVKDILHQEINTGYFSIVVLSAYLLGNIVSDLTDRMTDSNNQKEKSPVLIFLHNLACMPDVESIRELALVDSDNKLTGLGRDVLSSQKLIKLANTIHGTTFFLQGNSVQKNILKDTIYTYDMLVRTYKKNPKFINFISSIYYTSKNWCYSKEHEPLDELTSIQDRIDLSRSIVLLVTAAFIFLFLFYFIYLLKVFFLIIKFIISLENDEPNTVLQKEQIYFKGNTMFVIKSAFLFFSLGLICRESFKIGLLSYDKRAYGYFISHLNEPTFENDNKSAPVVQKKKSKKKNIH